jgi:hypothetical protein
MSGNTSWCKCAFDNSQAWHGDSTHDSEFEFILQGGDRVNFKELKAEWRIQKYLAFNEFNKDRKTALVSIKSLDFKHLMQCFKPTWNKTFGFVMRNKRGWELEGTILFNRYALWQKIGFPAPERRTKELSLSWRASTNIYNAPSFPKIKRDFDASAADASIIAPYVASSGLNPSSTNPEPAPTSLLGVIPLRVQDAMDFVKIMTKISGHEMLNTTQNIRMFDYSKAITEWLQENAAEKLERTRITSKNLHNLMGSSTGAEGLRLMMERTAEGNDKEAAAGDKRGQNKQKKTIEVAALVTRGAAILKTLEQRGRQNSTASRLTTSFRAHAFGSSGKCIQAEEQSRGSRASSRSCI